MALKQILNGGGTSGGNISFFNDTTTTCFMNSTGVGIKTTNPGCKKEVNGAVGINNGSPYAIINNNMQSGSLTIGSTNLSYGLSLNWTTNTAGLMMEYI